MKRPLIGITGPDKRISWGWWFGALSVWLAGGRPVRITPQRQTWLHRFDELRGLIIGGGDDIDPNLYTDVTDLDSDVQGEYDAERDAMESEVIRRGLAAGLPILGICRGAQLINVVHGGTLINDLRPIRKKTSNRWFVLPRKWLELNPESRVAGLIGTARAKINSLHHQAIDHLGEGLIRVGHDLDDITQAIEGRGEQFLVGVQWHPEYMPQVARMRRIFRALVQRAKARPGPRA